MGLLFAPNECFSDSAKSGLALSPQNTFRLGRARILRRSGSRCEASRLEREANAVLAKIHRQQCSGCTLNVLSVR